VRDAVFILLTSLQYHEKAHMLKTPHCGFRLLYLHASVRNPTPFLDRLEHELGMEWKYSFCCVCLRIRRSRIQI